MYHRKPIDEIPLSVLLDVKKKWEDNLRSLDTPTNWNRCRLCEYIDGNRTLGKNCVKVCPIAEDGWCRRDPERSRLVKSVWDDNVKVNINPDEVQQFLNMLSREIKSRGKNAKDVIGEKVVRVRPVISKKGHSDSSYMTNPIVITKVVGRKVFYVRKSDYSDTEFDGDWDGANDGPNWAVLD
jgi:hypothetical protein